MNVPQDAPVCVCLEPVQGEVMALGCGHTFHVECFDGIIRAVRAPRM